jgi:O-antigen ligase
VNPSLASLICASGIAGLFYLNRDKTVHTTKTLWLPTIYLLLIGSRPLSAWLGMTPPAGANVQLEGSPLDAAVFAALLLGAIVVLVRRGTRTRRLLIANWPIVIYFLYCLVSVTWSPHPDVALKRWIKAIDDLGMVLVVASDPNPIAAMKRLISRVGFVLLPMSVLFIKYYGDLGRGYTPDGTPMNTGVTTNKNILGLMVLVVALCTFWHVLTLLRVKNHLGRRRQLLAQVALLIFAISLLNMARSDTAIACSILGGGLIFACESRTIRRRPARIHALCLAIFLTGGLALLFGGSSDVMHAMGRSSTLSGRTDIWAAVIPAAPNALVGAGFESFWISPSALQVWHKLKIEGWWDPEALINEAHNGYLEVYLNLGLVGVFLIALILISGYRRAVAAFRKHSSTGGLFLAYIIAVAFYNITEAGFRFLDLMWIFLLLAIVSASGIVAGVVSGVPRSDKNGRARSRRQAVDGVTELLAEAVAYAAPFPTRYPSSLKGVLCAGSGQ